MNWQAFIIASLRHPQQVARQVLGFNPPLATRWQAMVLLTVLSTLMTAAAIALAGPGAMISDEGTGSPFASTAIELGINLFAVLLVTGVGQMAGGQGKFPDALLLMVWVQGVLLVWQVPQCLALIFAPGLFVVTVSIGIAMMFWLMTHAITVLHGFQSPFRVFLSMIGMFFLIGAAVAPFLQPMFASGV